MNLKDARRVLENVVYKAQQLKKEEIDWLINFKLRLDDIESEAQLEAIARNYIEYGSILHWFVAISKQNPVKE
jgi:hypothetical protein